MKKVTTIFKSLFMLVMVFVMAQACLPTGGVNPGSSTINAEVSTMCGSGDVTV